MVFDVQTLSGWRDRGVGQAVASEFASDFRFPVGLLAIDIRENEIWKVQWTFTRGCVMTDTSRTLCTVAE